MLKIDDEYIFFNEFCIFNLYMIRWASLLYSMLCLSATTNSAHVSFTTDFNDQITFSIFFSVLLLLCLKSRHCKNPNKSVWNIQSYSVFRRSISIHLWCLPPKLPFNQNMSPQYMTTFTSLCVAFVFCF